MVALFENYFRPPIPSRPLETGVSENNEGLGGKKTEDAVGYLRKPRCANCRCSKTLRYRQDIVWSCENEDKCGIFCKSARGCLLLHQSPQKPPQPRQTPSPACMISSMSSVTVLTK